MKLVQNFTTRWRAVVFSTLWPGLKRPVAGAKPVQSLINWATQTNGVLWIKYRDLDGNVSEREIEVISFTQDHVQANCLLRGGKFRQFIIGNIIDARWTGRCFVPRNSDVRRCRPDLKTPLHAHKVS